MDDRFRELRAALETAVLEAPGRTEPALRRAVADNREVPASLSTLVAKIHAHAYRVTDEDIDVLRDRHDQDELFEIVVAAALGAAGERLDAALAALEDA